MYTLGCRFVSRGSTVGQLIFGQHAICFHNSRILSNAVPLGFFCGGFSSTFGYDPRTSAQLAPSHSPSSAGPSKECHSFLSEWLEKTSQPSLAKPFGFDSGRQ
jgi:hypothetical protein